GDHRDLARRDLQLTAARLNDCVHIRHLCKGVSVAEVGCKCKPESGLQAAPASLDVPRRPSTDAGSVGPRYLSRTRVPRIFWLLSALRKFGTSRSISSKYDDNAGVFCCAL